MTNTFSFELFNKETYDKERCLDAALDEIIPEVQVPFNYLIDLMFSNFNEIYVPVFQKELDNKSIALEEYTEHCDYLPFEKFREKIESKPANSIAYKPAYPSVAIGRTTAERIARIMGILTG